MERLFPIKPGQPIEMALIILSSFSKSLIRTNNRFVKNGTANFGRNIPDQICGLAVDELIIALGHSIKDKSVISFF